MVNKSRMYQVTMNFIGYQNHLIFPDDLSNFFQLFFRPHSSHWIVGTAQKHQLDVFFCNLFLQIFKVDLIVAVLQYQRIFHNFPVIIPDHFVKRIVHRRLNQHAISWSCVCFYCLGQGKHHSWRLDDPVSLSLPPVMLFKPV